MWKTYILPANLDEALAALAEFGPKARVVAGSTDLMLELKRRQRPQVEALIDITRIAGLTSITLDEDGWVHLGPLVTHNHVVASSLLRERAFPLAKACWEIGSPQIRNRGTVAGNLITASPANDTIPPLMALGARVTLRSVQGSRTVALEDFYTGVRQTVMRPDEMLTDIAFPALAPHQRGTFLKLGLRRAQAISVVNAAVVVTFADQAQRRVDQVAITLGAVAPTIVHAREAEDYLAGKVLTPETIAEAARLAVRAARPIDDIRGSAAYRQKMVEVLVKRALEAVAEGREREGFPERPPLLWGQVTNPWGRPLTQGVRFEEGRENLIEVTVNGQRLTLQGGWQKSLLDLIRDHAGFTGPKEGCAEGECGACTVHLDGVAVMSCLVPAPRAHLTEVVTIEGLAQGDQLHPVQQAFVDAGAVQCGYCSPGFLMSAAKLLEENPAPDPETVRWALSGNLCRCTGYYKIIRAVERAVQGG